MDERPFNSPQRDDAVSPRFRRAMRQLADRADLLGVDDGDRMRAAAQAHFTGAAPQRRRARRWVISAAAAAACIALAATIIALLQRAPVRQRHMPAVTAAGPADVDGNGRVDIVDAFQLARELEAGRGDAGRDINNDGRIDGGDVDAIARIAVSLDEPEFDGEGGQAG